jgi:single-strand DNA-binding protein
MDMADGLNRVMLLGNLGADPELRFTQGGSAVLNMRIATTESYLDKDKVRRERTDWHNVVVWGKRGEALGKILTKGSSVFVEGSLRTSSYDDRDGNKRYKTEVYANNILLTGGRGRGAAPAEEGPSDAAVASTPAGGEAGYGRGGGNYAPRPAPGGAARPRPAPAPPAETPAPAAGNEGDDFGYGGGSDDDIPF